LKPALQERERVMDQGPAAQLNQGLGRGLSGFLHPGAEARGQDHHPDIFLFGHVRHL